MVECEGRMCCGYVDGTIGVWGLATLALERTLPAIAGGIAVRSNVSPDGRFAPSKSERALEIRKFPAGIAVWFDASLAQA
jgi:hypothetical protein